MKGTDVADRDDNGSEARTATTAMPPPSIPERSEPRTTAAAVEAVPATTTADSVTATDEPRTERRETSTGTAQTASRRPVFLPMALGGLVAGLMGYLVAWAQFGPASPFAGASGSGSSASADYQSQIDQLRSDLDALPEPQAFEAPEPFDASDIEQRLDSLESTQSDITARLDAPPANTPLIGDEAQQAAVDFLSQQIADQSGKLQAQGQSLQAQLDELQTGTLQRLQDQIDQQIADAEATRQQAADQAQQEQVRAAVARVQSAIEAGGPMTEQISALEEATGQPAPPALADVTETGVTAMSALRDAYPAAAREALAAARNAGEAGEESGGFTSFLRTQFNARSTTPQDGNSVDAILSRAQADLDAGQLALAVEKVRSLPDSARSAMSDWLSLAEARLAAVGAIDDLAATMTDN